MFNYLSVIFLAINLHSVNRIFQPAIFDETRGYGEVAGNSEKLGRYADVGWIRAKSPGASVFERLPAMVSDLPRVCARIMSIIP